jgi:hypothetical protein
MISSRVTHCQQPGSSIGTQPRAKLFREEPEAGNLHISQIGKTFHGVISMLDRQNPLFCKRGL